MVTRTYVSTGEDLTSEIQPMRKLLPQLSSESSDILVDSTKNSIVSLDRYDLIELFSKSNKVKSFSIQSKRPNAAIKKIMVGKKPDSVLVNVTGGADTTTHKCKKIVQTVSDCSKRNTKIIWSSKIAKNMKVPRVSLFLGWK